MPNAIDLCAIADVKSWLGLTANTDDAMLARLITSASQLFASLASRPSFASTQFTETRNGNDQLRMVLRYTPVISVSSVSIDGHIVPQSPTPLTAGWVNDENSVYLRSGSWAQGFVGIGWPSSAFRFNRGFQNVQIVYNGGYAAIPPDLTHAAIELVGQKYRRRSHIDQNSQSLGGQETISFSTVDVPKEVRMIINIYSLPPFME